MIAFEAPGVVLYHGDCLEVLRADENGYNYELGYGTRRAFPNNSVHAVVTDPPYALEFMGRGWDRFTPLEFEAWCAEWASEALRVLKPGGHLLAFGGSRTWHRLQAGIEDAGFEIRDSIAWLYGSGFPKSLDVSKAIDATLVHGGSHSSHIRQTNASRPGEGRMSGAKPINGIMSDRKAEGRVTNDQAQTAEGETWSGWGTALKPAFEPIVVARKPLVGTVARNVLEYETVAQRLQRFWAKHPEGRISTEVVNTTGDVGATRWVVRASLWSNRWEDREMTIKRIEPDATGIAVETDSDEGVNATSALENAETSAIGRALANLGFAGDKRPSREEMQKTRRRRPRRPKTTTQVRPEGSE